MGDRLKDLFPDLFLLGKNRNASIGSYLFFAL
jgi:hypothetical protein